MAYIWRKNSTQTEMVFYGLPMITETSTSPNFNVLPPQKPLYIFKYGIPWTPIQRKNQSKAHFQTKD